MISKSTFGFSFALHLFSWIGLSSAQDRSYFRHSIRELQNGGPPSSVFCRVVQVEADFLDSSESDYHCIFDAKDEDGISGIAYKIEGLPSDFVANNKEALNRGESYIQTNASKDKGNGKLKIPPGSEVKLVKNPNNNRHERRELTIRKQGTSNVLVLFVIAPDSTLTRTQADHRDSVFGNLGDPVNLKSQYAACSANKLNFVQAAGTNIDSGLAVINLGVGVLGRTRTAVMNDVTAAAQTYLGMALDNFDHVMYCLPPGTESGWIAYGYYNYYRTVYNDQWCTYVSGQMHEIGHNLGLRHSNQGTTEYGDQSGMMGYSYSQDDGPVMCFNAAKSWELGWYSDRHATINPFASSWEGRLAGINDYASGQTVSGVHTVVAKITRNNQLNVYVMYNKKEGINSGTVEFGNSVTVVEGDALNPSNVLASLVGSQTYQFTSFDGSSENLVIEVCELVTGVPDYARVLVYLDNSNDRLSCVSTAAPIASPTTAAPTTATPTASPTTKAPTSTPTKRPTKAPTSPPTLVPDGGRCTSNSDCASGICSGSKPNSRVCLPVSNNCGGGNAQCSANSDCCSLKCRRSGVCSF